jgi:hypothetical protein
MPFPRAVIFEACAFLGQTIQYHGDFEDIMLRWELDDLAVAHGAIHQRCRALFLFLRDNPEVQHEGRLITDLVVEVAVTSVARHRPGAGNQLVHALERAGFVLGENHDLRRALPAILDLPAADDEVHILLNRHNLAVPQGHLDQAIGAHTRGEWAAANGQIRSFLESLLDEAAYLLDANAPRGQNQHEARRQRLANLAVPFLSRDLNEWNDDGRGFVNGLFRRLSPQGAHPGLSDEEDSTFRLHLVLLVARLLLGRLDAAVPAQQ